MRINFAQYQVEKTTEIEASARKIIFVSRHTRCFVLHARSALRNSLSRLSTCRSICSPLDGAPYRCMRVVPA